MVIALAGIAIAASIYTARSTPVGIGGQAIFNVVMLRLLPHSPASMEIARVLELNPDEAKLSGRHAFLPDNPPIDWVGFYRRVFPRLVKWYALHPGETFRWLFRDLKDEAPRLRFNGGGNFRFEDGKAFGALTSRFSSWSTLKAAAIRALPEVLPIWYLGVLTLSLALLLSRSTAVTKGTLYVLIGISLIAVLEYCVSSLFDAAGETNRHLFLFHTLTDLTLVFAAAALCSLGRARVKKLLLSYADH